MKDMKVAYLLDFYGSLLSDKQREILEMYYQEDMSLAEIASVADMTRQGVHDNIRRGEKEIISLEEKLKLKDRFLAISESLDKIENLITSENVSGAMAEQICSELSSIRKLV